MSDVLECTATEAAQLIRNRDVSSTELTRAVLDRIDERNPEINAIAALRDEALADAAAADREPARGPLHGVPITIKESYDVAGMRTSWGEPEFGSNVAQRDSTVVRRLRDAGAIVVAKSNLAHMLADNQTDNPVYGRTNNPLDHSRTAGGSSGGAAAAVASGMSFLDFGTDLSGSVRNPAAFCGVYGLRPTFDTIPLTGMALPGPPQIPVDAMSLVAAGPIARSVADLRTAVRVSAGPEGPAALAHSWRLPEPRHRALQDFRVGYVVEDPVTAEVAAELHRTIDALRAAGVSVTEGWPKGVDPRKQFADFAFQVDAFFALTGDDTLSHRDFVTADNRRIMSRLLWCEYFRDFDVFLCPATATVAFPHETRCFDEREIDGMPYTESFYWTAHASLTGLPALVAPVGRTAAGLPVGIQVIGPVYEDDTALTFAECAFGARECLASR